MQLCVTLPHRHNTTLNINRSYISQIQDIPVVSLDTKNLLTEGKIRKLVNET